MLKIKPKKDYHYTLAKMTVMEKTLPSVDGMDMENLEPSCTVNSKVK
jgi:hypothetical protein